jgi:hypothetical protein
LNYLSGRDPTAKTTDAGGGYVLATPQGPLDSYIVLASGGGAQGNDDVGPTPFNVENGFKTTDANPNDFIATGTATGSALSSFQQLVPLGNMNDPDNNALTTTFGANADSPGTWDVGLQWIIDALTIEGVRRDLMIGFDYNQTQNTDTSLAYWGLVTVRDVNGILPDINFEIRSDPGVLPEAYNTEETFNSKPESGDFSVVNGVTCVDTNGSEAIPILPIPGGQCPAGYELALNNAQSTSTTEIFAFLPELNARLEFYLAQGYDVISTRVLLGCFGGTAGGSFNPGIGYLSDEATGGATTDCENGGFADIFLLAGAPTTFLVPEPQTVTLFGLGLLGIVAVVAMRRRRVQA